MNASLDVDADSRMEERGSIVLCMPRPSALRMVEEKEDVDEEEADRRFGFAQPSTAGPWAYAVRSRCVYCEW